MRSFGASWAPPGGRSLGCTERTLLFRQYEPAMRGLWALPGGRSLRAAWWKVIGLYYAYYPLALGCTELTQSYGSSIIPFEIVFLLVGTLSGLY